MSTITHEATELEKSLAAEVQKLRTELYETRSVLKALEESIKDSESGPSWLQSKNMAQRSVLRTLNNRVRNQRIVLSMVNKVNLGPTYDEIVKRLSAVAEQENLSQEEIDTALAWLV